MKAIKFFSMMLCLVASMGFVSCGDDGDEPSYSGSWGGDTGSSISKPTITKVASATTTTDLEVTFRVSNSGSPSVVMYYGTSEDNLTKTKTCRYYSAASKNYDFYKASLTGLRSGSKIYFKGVATNSAGSDETKVYSHIVKR